MNFKLLVGVVATGAFLITSCGNNKAKVDFSKRNKELLDSMNGKYQENISYSFADASVVYSNANKSEVKDTLSFATLLYVDSIFSVEKDSQQVHMYAINYISDGAVLKGIMDEVDVAIQSFKSKKDPELLFIANYIPVKDQTAAIIKAVRNNQKESELAIDTAYMQGFYMDMFLADSIKLSNTNELFYLNTYYPACGYASTHYYMDYVNKKFKVVLSEMSWFDAPYYNSPSIYLPTVLDSKSLLFKVWGNTIQRDSTNKPYTYPAGEKAKPALGELIYVEYWQNTDSTINGKTLLDEYNEPALFDVCFEKKLYHWDGQKLILIEKQ